MSPPRSSWLRSPLLHFLVLGVVLFAAHSSWTARQRSAREASPSVSISPERLAALESEFVTQSGRRATDSDRARLLENEIADEILLAEARARGLHEFDGGVQTRMIQKMLFLDSDAKIEDAPALLARAKELELDRGDIVVRRILIQKMKLLASALRESEMPDATAIEARYAERRDSMREPDRLDLHHVFFSIDERGEQAHTDPLQVREKLVRSTFAPDQSIALGDPFPLGHHLSKRSERDLVRSFGAGFGPAVLALPTATWSEPIESAYGLHLVFVTQRAPGEVPPLPAVEDSIRRTLEHERQQAKLTAFQKRLRTRYDVSVPELNAKTSPEES